MAKPKNEEDFFKKQEQERAEKLRREAEVEREAKALEERKATHYHRCGKCGAHMDTTVFRGVEIEVCPECGSVLLDPGELEELAGEDQSGMMHAIASIFGGRS